MSPKLEALATCGAGLSSLAKDYPDVVELRTGLTLVMDELKKEIQSVAKKQQRAAAS